MHEKLKVVQVVKNFGPVGGMERYVWELVHALANEAVEITVLCETVHAQAAANIQVIEIGKTLKKPGWLSTLLFARKVAAYIHKNHAVYAKSIIHSHIRTSVHHVTTFHSAVFKHRKKKFLDILSPRIYAWLYLEKMELCGSQVQAVLPNSNYIAYQLKQNYPCCIHKIAFTALPCVGEQFYSIPRLSNGKTIGFIGREWKRKGLELACEIVKTMLSDMPELKLIVAGPPKQEIAHLFTDWQPENYVLLGWVDSEIVIGQIDVLLHPAQSEPFGMVIAEANAAGVPCLISEHCGIADMFTAAMGAKLPLQNKARWIIELKRILQQKMHIQKIENLSWKSLAKKQLALYSDIAQNIF